MTTKRCILLADCNEKDMTQFAEKLFFNSRPFEIRSHIANWKRTGVLSEVKRYAMYFGVAFRYFMMRKSCAAVVGWQQFYALIFCFFCSLFSVKKTCEVVALNFTYKEKKGKLAAIYRWFMEKCVDPTYMDYLHVPSASYADWIHQEFGFPRERIIVTGFGVEDRYDELKNLPAPEQYEKEGYALAIGRSNRDFDFLIKAWEQIDFPLVIISDTYKGTTSNEQVKLIGNVAGEASYAWIVNCATMILPIDDGTICSGDTVLLTAMSLKRKIAVTIPSVLAEMYVVDGETGMCLPKEEEKFAEGMSKLLFTNEYSHLGTNARDAYLKQYTLSHMGECFTNAWTKNNITK